MKKYTIIFYLCFCYNITIGKSVYFMEITGEKDNKIILVRINGAEVKKFALSIALPEKWRLFNDSIIGCLNDNHFYFYNFYTEEETQLPAPDMKLKSVFDFDFETDSTVLFIHSLLPGYKPGGDSTQFSVIRYFIRSGKSETVSMPFSGQPIQIGCLRNSGKTILYNAHLVNEKEFWTLHLYTTASNNVIHRDDIDTAKSDGEGFSTTTNTVTSFSFAGNSMFYGKYFPPQNKLWNSSIFHYDIGKRQKRLFESHSTLEINSLQNPDPENILISTKNEIMNLRDGKLSLIYRTENMLLGGLYVL